MIALIVFAASLPFLGPDRLRLLENVLTLVAVFGCVLMLSWMSVADGARSRLWRWLPPFWPWGYFLTGAVARWGLVLLLVAGTIMGIISGRFAR